MISNYITYMLQNKNTKIIFSRKKTSLNIFNSLYKKNTQIYFKMKIQEILLVKNRKKN